MKNKNQYLTGHTADTMKASFKRILKEDSVLQKGSIYEWRDIDQDINAYDYGDNYELPIALMKNLKEEGFVKDETLTEDFKFEGFDLTMTVWKNKEDICDWMCPLSMFIAGYSKGANERVLIEFINSK